MRPLSFTIAIVAAITVGLGTVAVRAAELPEAPVALRASSVVDADLIHLGDLFDNTGELAIEPVAYAPDPGRQATYGAKWLFQIARHFRLDWQPVSIRDAVVVRRDSIVIDREEIEQLLADEILGDLAEPGMSVRLANRSLEMHIPTDASADIAISDLVYDERTQRLSAVVSAPADDPTATRIRVTGEIINVIEVPVLARPVAAGETIRLADLNWVEANADKVPRDTLVTKHEIVGMTPRRGLRAGSTVRANEIIAPQLIAKNSLVTVSVEQPGMRLTAQGKALEAGALGEVIRVMNSRSNTVIEAVVTGAGQASAKPAAQIAMN